MTRIKICGITTPADARLAVAAGASAVGLVFAPSPRRVSLAQAQRIIDVVPPFVATVGVFVNASRRDVLQTLKKCRLQALQFQGEESNLYCASFGSYCKIIKAFRLETRDSLAAIAAYPDVDAVLLDGFDILRRGGTGKRFPLTWVSKGVIPKPLIVAGGLTPRNVGQVIHVLRPYAVDVSSGVEQVPGRKDARQIAALCRAVRRKSFPES